MNYIISTLQSNAKLFSVLEYLPYTDISFFKSLDEIIKDEDASTYVSSMLAQLYNEELIIKNSSINNYDIIVPISHLSKKFDNINKTICKKISSITGIKYIDDFFINPIATKVDIRDEYTKETHKIEVNINEKYFEKSVIFFDICCSTGQIFHEIDLNLGLNFPNSLFIAYAIRFNAHEINNTKFLNKQKVQSEILIDDLLYPGYLVKIYGLFGNKNIEIDMRKKFSIVIGENGYGKSTGMKLATLAINYNKLSKSEFARYYFDKIEVYYYFWADKDNNEIEFDALKTDDMINHKIIDKKEYKYVKTLLHEIKYIDVIPSKEELLSDNNNNNILCFFNILNYKEYMQVIRKAYLDDLSIQVDFNNISIKYKKLFNFNEIYKFLTKNLKINQYNKTNFISTFDNSVLYFNCAYNRYLTPMLSKDVINVSSYEVEQDTDFKYIDNEDYVDYVAINNYDYETLREEYEYYVNENESSLTFKEYVALYVTDDYNEEEDSEEDIVYIIKNSDSIIEQNDLRYENNLLFRSTLEKKYRINNGYLYDDKYNQTSEIFELDMPIINKYISESDISLHNILRYDFDNTSYYTNFYSLLNKIFEYENESIDNKSVFKFYKPLFFNELTDDDLKLIPKDKKFNGNNKVGYKIINYCYSDLLEERLSNYIIELYNDIYNKLYDDISFGVYDVLNKNDYNKLSSIVNRLRDNGLITLNDYISTLGLFLLIQSYNKTMIKSKNLLLEKLINKYLIGKKVKVYSRNLNIKDSNGLYIPINMLSTGEKNIIILFFLCLYRNDGLVILDEPDLSMSVEWQTKILIDIIKYSQVKLLVVSQSPLLIQKNGLSSYVIRLDIDKSDDMIETIILDDNKVDDDNGSFDEDNDKLPF